MLQGEFYDIVSHEDTSFSLCFHLEHPIYKAHFPDTPITPGVCFVQIAQELLSKLIRASCLISEVQSLKLFKIHTPEKTLVARFQLQDQQKTTCTFEQDEVVIAMLKFRYTLWPKQPNSRQT